MKINRTTRSASLHREIKLGRSQFQVVTPFRLRIKAERDGGQQVAARGRVCQVKNVLRRGQALVRIARIARLINVITEREVGGQSPSEIRTNQRSCGDLPSRIQRRRIHERRAMTDVAVL